MPKPVTNVYYGDYLKLPELLACQELESAKHGGPVHDELLFIITHQAYELWFKQILWELDAVLEIFGRDSIDERHMGRVVAHMRRIAQIQRLFMTQIEILETMTPLDFLEFRDFLLPASGFQSVQFRLIENKLGVPSKSRLKIDDVPYTERFSPEDRERILASERESSLFELVERWLARTPFLRFGDFDFWKEYRAAVDEMLRREREQIEQSEELDATSRKGRLARHAATVKKFDDLFQGDAAPPRQGDGPFFTSQARLAALLINLYRDEPILHLPFVLLTALMDIDETFTNWRYRHALMAMRMIGGKMGTGGTSGVEYLRQAAEKSKVFGELFELSSYFIPRSALPKLPAAVAKRMGFQT